MDAHEMPMPGGLEGVTLSGEALYGVGPPGVRSLVGQLPQTVRLGRIRTAARPFALPFGPYLDEARAKAALPPSINRRDKAAASLARMYLNDRFGCCVISGKMHALGLWSGADANPDGVVVATDQEVYSQYQGICGPGDRGCVITQVLDVMRSRGMIAGGKAYRIDGYVSVDWRNRLEVQTVQYLFGASTIGINLPSAWTSSAVWDVTSSRIIGGHDVTPIDYDEQGVYVSSWGRIYLMTWAAFTATRWVEEYYALLAPLWYGADNLAPCGVDAATLKADLIKLGGGIIPPIPDPVPPTPPTPPVPPVPPTPGVLPAVLVALNESGQEIARYKPV